MTAHPRHRLDELIHAPARLSIMAALAAADELHFGYLRDSIEVSDSLLSKHLSTLESAGYVVARKGYVGKRPRTWFSLSLDGRAAYDTYLDTLRAIVEGPVPSG